MSADGFSVFQSGSAVHVNPRAVMIENTLAEIEREVGRLDMHQRLAVQFALERLEAEARSQGDCGWCDCE